MTFSAALTTEARLHRAVRAEIAEHGLARTTMTSLAARAQVSRMTAYRRGVSVERVVLDALTEDVRGVLETAVDDATPARIGEAAAGVVHMLIANRLFRALQDERPALLASYTVERLGAVQQLMVTRVRELIEQGQQQGYVRRGEAAELALTLLIAVQGFALMREPVPDLAGAIRDLVVRYLKVDQT